MSNSNTNKFSFYSDSHFHPPSITSTFTTASLATDSVPVSSSSSIMSDSSSFPASSAKQPVNRRNPSRRSESLPSSTITINNTAPKKSYNYHSTKSTSDLSEKMTTTTASSNINRPRTSASMRDNVRGETNSFVVAMIEGRGNIDNDISGDNVLIIIIIII